MTAQSTWQKVLLAAVAAAAAFGAGALIRPSAGTATAQDDLVAPRVRAKRAPLLAENTAAADASASSSRLEPEVAFNPFGPLNTGAPAVIGQPKSGSPPPKRTKSAAAPAAPPPPPVAPALPFVAMGSMSGASVTDGQPVAFLQQQERLLVVRAGESVGGSWRVESITPQRIEFIYLPLMQRQSLPLAP